MDNSTTPIRPEIAQARATRGGIPEILQREPDLSLLDSPKITVITIGYNNGPYLRDTLNSILNQTYKNFECIVMDGGSKDETVSILKEYPNVRWVSEKDSGTLDAMWKALKMAKGEYIMSCYVTDGYLDQDWLKKCAEALDNNPEVSLVWGLPQYLLEDGTLGEISYEQFFGDLPPQREEFIYYWLTTHFALPEGNVCARKNVFEQCMITDLKSVENYWLELSYRFFSKGYLPYFIPSVANFGRRHPNSSIYKKSDLIMLRQGEKIYHQKVNQFRKKLEKTPFTYQYINFQGEKLPYVFSLKKHYQVKAAHRRTLSYLIKSNIKKILPTSLKLAVQKYITKSISQ